MERLFTIGAYGFDAQSFFNTLEQEQVDLLVDVRRRRGIRGREYAFGNATELQSQLKKRGIAYRHVLDLAPTPETRSLQAQANRENRVAKRKQALLADGFVVEYARRTLEPFDWHALIQELQNSERPALFCVEKVPQACHRHLVAERISALTGIPVTDLVP